MSTFFLTTSHAGHHFVTCVLRMGSLFNSSLNFPVTHCTGLKRCLFDIVYICGNVCIAFVFLYVCKCMLLMHVCMCFFFPPTIRCVRHRGSMFVKKRQDTAYIRHSGSQQQDSNALHCPAHAHCRDTATEIE